MRSTRDSNYRELGDVRCCGFLLDRRHHRRRHVSSGGFGRRWLDIEPRFLAATRPNLELWLHDIVQYTSPEAAFDLVHARLVLMHLPEREKALHRMLTVLKPGG
jgi:SAM-dependent methyltransferase